MKVSFPFPFLPLCVCLCPLAVLTADCTGPHTFRCSPHLFQRSQSELKQETFKKPQLLFTPGGGVGLEWEALITLRLLSSLIQGPRAHPKPLTCFQEFHIISLETSVSLPSLILPLPLQCAMRLQLTAPSKQVSMSFPTSPDPERLEAWPCVRSELCQGLAARGLSSWCWMPAWMSATPCPALLGHS